VEVCKFEVYPPMAIDVNGGGCTGIEELELLEAADGTGNWRNSCGLPSSKFSGRPGDREPKARSDARGTGKTCECPPRAIEVASTGAGGVGLLVGAGDVADNDCGEKLFPSDTAILLSVSTTKIGGGECGGACKSSMSTSIIQFGPKI
jgi:hypothetical protein